MISFGWDDSTKFGLSVTSTNTQIEPKGAPGTVRNVVQRGATLAGGSTAEAQAASIEKKIFTPGRLHLEGWRDTHEAKFKVGTWAAAGAPDPEPLGGMHRLAEAA